MDLFTILPFVASVIKSLAWPVATIVLARLLRPEIANLAPLIKRIKAGPIEAEFFGRDVEEVKRVFAEQKGLDAPRIEEPTSPDFLLGHAGIDPRTTILGSWDRLMRAANILARTKPILNRAQIHLGGIGLLGPLSAKGIINGSQVALFYELDRLRNELVKETSLMPTPEAARNFVQLAASLQKCLEDAAM